MATDKQPRSSAAKRTSTGISKVPSTSEPVSTATPTAGTARNSLTEGNGAADLDEIRKRAYELYEEDGRQDGKHEDHWLRAESEVRDRVNGKSKPGRQDDKSKQRIA
jgi:hypothetical protein